MVTNPNPELSRDLTREFYQHCGWWHQFSTLGTLARRIAKISISSSIPMKLRWIMESWAFYHISYHTALSSKNTICLTHTYSSMWAKKLNIVIDHANILRPATRVQSWLVQLIINETLAWWDVQTLQFKNFLHNPVLMQASVMSTATSETGSSYNTFREKKERKSSTGRGIFTWKTSEQ